MSKPVFSLEQVGTFVAVARTRSMSRAAEDLFITQGAVSQQISHLERALGLRLVERGGRQLLLTEAGAAVADACSTALRDAETIVEVAQSLRGLAVGSLRIGASPTCAGHYLPPLLAAFTRELPQAEVAVTVASTPSIYELVATGQLDCGLVEGPEGTAKLEERRISEDEIIVVAGAGHPLAAAVSLSPSDLAAHRYLCREPLSVPPRKRSLEAHAADMLGRAFRDSPRLVLTQPDAIRAAAMEGLGYTVLPLLTARRELASRALVRLPLPSRSRWIRAVRRSQSRVPAVERFWSLLPPEPNVAAVKARARGTAPARR